MENPKKIYSFIEQFCTNSNGVLSTITNKTVELNPAEITSFDFELISNSVEIPAILVTITFSESHEFSVNLILPKKLVAILADLMMLGEGDVEYNPEEHNDAIQEMINQILGSLVAELSAQEIKLSATATEVEVTDMEIQKEFLVDSSMSQISMNILEQDFSLFFVLDQVANDSIEDMLKDIPSDDEEMSEDKVTSAQANTQKKQREPQEEVNISRPAFSDMPDNSHSVNSDVNIELLLDITLPVTVELGKKNMKIKQILELGQGSIVELDKLVGDHVDLMVNGKKFAKGEIMVADENLAIRVVTLISRDERIKSLG
ncbi:MAG: FliM/FliN family flagellar motor switch protein [Candidatus Cloacimonadota bacterium]|nr:FliM/FliN family flagellar motor switch protein [Candidatus Cloacimonadota bacterium]